MNKLTVLLAGIVIGYALSLLSSLNKLTPPVASSSPTSPSLAIAPPHKSDISSPILKVTLVNSKTGEKRQVLGILLKNENLVILKASHFYEVDHAYISVKEKQINLGNVLAYQIPLNLVLVDLTKKKDELKNSFQNIKSFNLSNDANPLFLGKRFDAYSLNGKTSGWIDSAAMTGKNPSTFLARLEKDLKWTNGVLTTPTTPSILGFVIKKTAQKNIYEVVGKKAINAMITSINITESLTIPAFSNYFGENTTMGRRLKMGSLHQKEKWNELRLFAIRILEKDNQQSDSFFSKLETAFIRLIQKNIASRQHETATQLLNEANFYLGENSDRLMLKAKNEILQENFNQARLLFHQAFELNPERASEILPKIRKTVLALLGKNESMTNNEKISLLEDEVVIDAVFPDYRKSLGLLYFNKGDYENALLNFDFALQLNHLLSDSITPLIETAENRINRPDIIDIPLESQGGTFYVNTYLNNTADPFRFILDTGASFTSITSDTAKRIGLKIRDINREIVLHTANGKITAKLLTLNEISIGEAQLKNIEIIILDNLNHADGLLGLSFLKHFSMDFQPEKNKLILSNP